eukprot:737566-Amphidinium_carterae.1
MQKVHQALWGWCPFSLCLVCSSLVGFFESRSSFGARPASPSPSSICSSKPKGSSSSSTPGAPVASVAGNRHPEGTSRAVSSYTPLRLGGNGYSV